MRIYFILIFLFSASISQAFYTNKTGPSMFKYPWSYIGKSIEIKDGWLAIEG